ncbi:MAG: radical SAM family heme chaperone HemW [Rikenellaceae bacterium]|nr:radical SAM family heme chaperone HemW [Rikenellaceae bacterium]
MAGIYLHIPFCKRICSYCDFYRTALLKDLPAVVEAMCREIEQRQNYLGGAKIGTRYLGGGTPSCCSVEQLEQLMTTSERFFDCSEVEETTLEANPDDLTGDYLKALRRIGINRLSMGIQSFDDDCLKLMNRRHTAQEAEEAVKRAQDAGFENLTIDLMFGLPGFGEKVLERSLERALKLGVQHISAYLLTIEERTRFGAMVEKGAMKPISDEEAEAEYLLVHKRLTEAGFEHYEVSNYALKGYRARHNSRYWDSTPYLGIGPAAHSFDGKSRSWNVSSVTNYLAGAAPETEILTAEEQREEFLMTRLRTSEGFSLSEYEARFGATATALLLREVELLRKEGLLSPEKEQVQIPQERLLLSDRVIGALF